VGVGFASDGSQNFYVLVAGRPSSGGPAPPAPVTQAARPLIITPIRLAQPREDGAIVHVVQPGQALWSLAAHYEVSLRDLLLLNSLPENAFLQPGQEIYIRLPEGMAPPPTPTPPLTHTVQRGQTLWTIAAMHQVRLADLLWLNNLNEESMLQPGQEIRLFLAEGEQPPPTPTPISHHVVRSGQTLWDIALAYRLSLEELLAYNDITAQTIIRPGDELRIRPPEPTATPTAVPTTLPDPVPATPTAGGVTAVAQAPSLVTTATTAPPTVTATPPITPTAAPAAGDGNLTDTIVYIAATLLLLGVVAGVWRVGRG
jgi:LysM repeat protein